MRMEKKNYPHVYLEECKYRMKKTKMTKFMEAELKSESESELESDIEFVWKSDTEWLKFSFKPLNLNKSKVW